MSCTSVGLGTSQTTLILYHGSKIYVAQLRKGNTSPVLGHRGPSHQAVFKLFVTIPMFQTPQRDDVSAFVKLERIEYRAVIKYLFLKGNTTTQIKDELDSVYGNSIPSFTLVKFWAAEFKRGHKSLGDDERSGRPNTATTDENITKFH
ncbi:HTH_48 domain-containing protein [Trichonephila clavipes]|nr:HTH_48 domain-containing protein [Trichonephila clavipes]